MNEESQEGQGSSGGEAPDRIADRVAVKLPVKLELDTSQGDEPALTGNVSNTGMYVAYKSPPPVGTLARFEIQRVDGPAVRGIGEVAWIRVRWSGKGRPPGMGIHFRFLDEQGKESLAALIADGIARGLKIEGSADTDRSEAPPPEEPDFVPQHRPYGKPLTMDSPLRPVSRPTRPTPAPASAPEGDDEASQGWAALRKWANTPAPVGPKNAGSATPTPVLGGLSDKAKFIVLGVLLLIFLIVLL